MSDSGNDRTDDRVVPIDAVFDLAEAAALDALTRYFPRPSIARLDEIAEMENGSAIIYAIYMMWIDAWMNTLRNAFPRITPDDYWEFANNHILTPGNGGNAEAGNILHGLLIYRIDGIAGTDELTDDEVSAFDYVYENVYCRGSEFRNEFALLLLFMIKAAFVERSIASAARTGNLD